MRCLLDLGVQQTSVASNTVHNVKKNFCSPNGTEKMITRRINYAIVFQGFKIK